MIITFDKDELELTPSSVIIRLRNASSQMATGIGGERTIAIREISAVQIKLSGMLPGYIIFSYPGSKPFRGGVMEATQHPDAFMFRKSENGAIATFKSKLDQAMADARATPNVSVPSVADELQKLSSLRDAGHLTPDEFERAKAKLLA